MIKKKYYITESQFKKIIIDVSKDGDKQQLDEGFKEVVLTGLLTLASLAGISQEKTLTQDEIQKAEQIQQRLDSGDKTVYQYFDSANIELNRTNLEKLKSVDIDTEISRFKTKNPSTVKSKLKQGYTLTNGSSDVIDTNLLNVGDVVYVDTTTVLQYDAMFTTGGYNMSSESKSDILKTLQIILENKGTIKSVIIESSTDKEPIKMGNDMLAKLRSNIIYDLLIQSYVEAPIKIINLPNQGPDVYTKQMSQIERNEAREQTSKFRYNKIIINATFERGITTNTEIDDVINNIQFELVKPKETKKGKIVKGGTSTNIGKKIVFKCRQWFKNGKNSPNTCPRF